MTVALYILAVWFIFSTWLFVADYIRFKRKPHIHDKFRGASLVDKFVLYYIAPVFVLILTPFFYIDRQKELRDYYKNYLETGEIFWVYLESKYFRKDKKFEELITSIAKDGKTRMSLADAENAVYRAFTDMDIFNMRQLTPHLWVHLKDGVVRFINFSEPCQCFDVHLSDKVIKYFTLDEIIDSYKERHGPSTDYF